MKDHIMERRPVEIDGPISDVIEQLTKASEGLLEARVYDDSWGGDPYYIIKGWRPMNEDELAKAKARRKAAAAAVKAKKDKLQAKELAELARLKEKYEHDKEQGDD
jgi:hypothetical protein